MTKHGLLRQHKSGQWEALTIQTGDRISPDSVIIGGKPLPLWRPLIGGLTRNAVIPHIMAIYAGRCHIAPVPEKRKYPICMAIRLLTIWPPVIIAFLFAPLLLWDIPDGLNLNIRHNIYSVFLFCGIMSIVLFIGNIAEGSHSQKRFSNFLAEIETIKQSLHWK